MTTPIALKSRRIRAVTGWLMLAASPTFAVMAWIATGRSTALCATEASGPPLDGMVWMYLLMSLFHLPPWLRLASRCDAIVHPFYTRTEGD